MGVLLDTSKEVPKTLRHREVSPRPSSIDASGKVRYYFINKRDWSRPEARRVPGEPALTRGAGGTDAPLARAQPGAGRAASRRCRC